MRKSASVTNEDLARLVKQGFDGVDTRLDKVEHRLDRIDARLERIERVILADHERRLARLEGALALPK